MFIYSFSLLPPEPCLFVCTGLWVYEQKMSEKKESELQYEQKHKV